jgi:lipoate-protein ligase A
MAADEAILETAARGQSNPALRLYAWSPPCLSLGYAQPISDVDLDQLSSLGWDLVRRPTGGRAILHTDELTYSVIAPLSEPRVSGSVLDSYQTLSQALLRALWQLGVPAQSLEKKDGNFRLWKSEPRMLRSALKLRNYCKWIEAGRKRSGSPETRLSPAWLASAIRRFDPHNSGAALPERSGAF